MILALKTKTAVLAAVLAVGATAASLGSTAGAGSIEAPRLVELKPGTVRYVAAGEFTRDGKPVNAPEMTITIKRPLAIMANEVRVAEYQRCVDDGACARLAAEAPTAPDRPAVLVSWRDAQAYAAWLSGKLGARYRLPTDEEWVFAAGSRAPNDAPLAVGSDDPIKRWLYQYDRESRAQPLDPAAQPIGSFGVNENGLVDVAGNVWEWTDTCYTRSVLDDGEARVVTTNCGVRVVEGRHRAYISDFIRDARAGGCAVGLPPSNVGFRLVREPKPSWWFLSLLAARARLGG